MAQSTKDMLKHEITVLQETLGIHLITTRNITSINEGREALVQIVRCFNSPKKDVTNELLTENKITKHRLWATEKIVKNKQEEILRLRAQIKKLTAENTVLSEDTTSYKNIIKILKHDRHDLLITNQILRNANKPWWSRIFG